MQTENLLTSGQVARRLEISASRVVQLINDGVLPVLLRVGAMRLFRGEDVEALAADRELRPAVKRWRRTVGRAR
jgi:excisionase family DNA binding protein